jgi:FkbM family methyltransferase
MKILSTEEAKIIINQKFELDALLKFNGESKSQLKQDIFVLSETNFKQDGYFVEFGATDGMTLSNTYLLETKFNWRGIVAEPLKSKYSELIKNRTCHVEDLCVWSESGKVLEFNETPNSDFSTINQFSSSDFHIESRRGGNIFNVETISLYDLLEKYNAPRYIDYLSIDTEGSEYEILKNFDFEKYAFKVITCEHNHTEMRDKIFTLLTSNGYIRKFENLSQWDDWYVKN